MEILLGTKSGLARLGSDGHLEWLLKGEVSAIGGGYAVVDGTSISTLDNATRIKSSLLVHCLTPMASVVLAGTAEARLLSLNPSTSTATPVDSFDRIPTRDEWYTPWGGPPDTRSIAVASHDTVLVSVHVGGVWRAEDDGSWTEVVPVDNDTHHVLAAEDAIVIAAAVGFGQSDDGGRTFRWTTAGLHDTYCRSVAVADGNVLLSASTGPFTQHGAVYLRPLDSEEPFMRCDNGLPDWFAGNIDTYQMAAHDADVVLGTDDGRVFVSQDAGTTWEQASAGIDAIRCVAIA